jgi:inward rectifier potassium channel
MKTRPKGAGSIPLEREPADGVARLRLGSYEFKKKGVSRFDLRDPYHLAVTLTWPQFLAALLALYLSLNVVFTILFWLVPGSVANARPDSFSDAFFFSIETLATVGYGKMYPATLHGHMVASIEIVCGLAFTAVLTGLTFVRFSRPRAKLIFAANPVVATTTEGKVFHRAQELQLERAHIPIFPLFWTLMHVLDERSPLNGYDAARAVKANAQVFVAIEARDPTLATTVHDIRNYPAEDVRFGMRYTEAVTTARDGTPVLDLTAIGALEPDVGDRQEQGWTEREENV